MTLDQNLVAAIAAKFTKDLMAYLTASQWSELCAKLHEARYQYPICPSHDYCDANEFMASAIDKVWGPQNPNRGMDTIEGEAATLWNEAWDIARKSWVGAA